MKKFLILLGLLFLTHACKKYPRDINTLGTAAVTPVLDTERSDTIHDWGSVEFNEHGYFADKLILSLDQIVAEPTSGSKPGCLAPVGKDVVVGSIVCMQGSAESKELRAEFIYQECYTRPDLSVVQPTKTFEMTGCKMGRIRGYSFRPQFKIDVEG